MKAKRRILCVDDDKDTREMIEALLGLQGYEVIQARNITEGLRCLGSENFELILLDGFSTTDPVSNSVRR